MPAYPDAVLPGWSAFVAPGNLIFPEKQPTKISQYLTCRKFVCKCNKLLKFNHI